MKRYNILLATLLGTLMALLAGCSNERAVTGGENPNPVTEDVNVTFDLSVGIETYSIPAQPYEKNISDVTAVVYDNAGNYQGIPSLSPIAGGGYGFAWPHEGNFQVLVVTNLSNASTLLVNKSLSDAQKAIVTDEPGRADNFVMVSAVQSVEIKENQATPMGTINVKRLAARIDIQTTIDKLTLDKVTVKNWVKDSQLSLPTGGSVATASRAKEDKAYTSFTVYNTTPSTQASVGQIYTYENAEADMSLVIDAKYDNVAVKPITVTLPAIIRNYIYSVQLVMSDKEYNPSTTDIKFVLEVADWNTGATISIDSDQLEEVIKNNTAWTSYAFKQFSTDPATTTNLDWNTSHSIQVTAVADKTPMKGTATTGGATQITGATNFNYEVVDAANTPWISVTPEGVITVSKNETEDPRSGRVKVTIKEDTNKVRTEKFVEISQQAAPSLTKSWTLTSVTPNPVTFTNKAGSIELTIQGEYKEVRGSVTTTSRALTIDDVTITKEPTANWVTISGNKVTVEANTGKVARSTTLTVKVNGDTSKTAQLTVKQGGLNENNPLAYVAQWNVTRSKTWDKNHTIPSSSSDTQLIINWNDARSLFNTPQAIEGSSEQYQLPTREQWQSILPYYGNAYAYFGGTSNYNSITESVTVAGKTFNATSDYQPRTYAIAGINNGQAVNCNVALRFKGSNSDEQPFKSAWLYYWGTNNAGTNGLHILCVNVADDTSITSVNDLNAQWWANNQTSAVRRFFPAASGSHGLQGSNGNYWSSTEFSSDYAYGMFFYSGHAYVYYNWHKAVRLSVRLFSLEPLD